MADEHVLLNVFFLPNLAGRASIAGCQVENPVVAATGRYRPKQLIDGIPNDSLTVFDRRFLSAEILCALTRGGSERHFIIPTKSNTRWEVIEGDENGDDFTVRRRDLTGRTA